MTWKEYLDYLIADGEEATHLESRELFELLLAEPAEERWRVILARDPRLEHLVATDYQWLLKMTATPKTSEISEVFSLEASHLDEQWKQYAEHLTKNIESSLEQWHNHLERHEQNLAKIIESSHVQRAESRKQWINFRILLLFLLTVIGSVGLMIISRPELGLWFDRSEPAGQKIELNAEELANLNILRSPLLTLHPFILGLMIGYSAATPLTAAEPQSILQPAPAGEQTNNSREEIFPSPAIILQKVFAAFTAQFKPGGNSQEMVAFLERAVTSHFDFNYMAQLAASYYWNFLDNDQRHLYEENFRYLFYQGLARRIFQLGNFQLYPIPADGNPNEMTVSARVISPRGIISLLDFRFYRSAHGWKIFDVMADSGSAILHYRRWYADRVARYGLHALLGIY